MKSVLYSSTYFYYNFGKYITKEQKHGMYYKKGLAKHLIVSYVTHWKLVYRVYMCHVGCLLKG